MGGGGAVRRERKSLIQQLQVDGVQRLLDEIGRLARSPAGIDETVRACLPLAREAAGADIAELWLLDQRSSALKIKGPGGPMPEGLFERASLSVGDGLPGLVAGTGESRVLAAGEIEGLRRDGVAAVAAHPLLLKGRVLGVLCLGARDGCSLQALDQAVVRRVTDAMALVLGAAQLHRRVEVLAEENEKAVQAAEIERSRIRALVESSLGGVYVTDAGTRRILFANKEFGHITGIHFRPGRGGDEYRRDVQLLRTDGTPYTEADLPTARAMATGQPVRLEEIIVKLANGTSARVLVNAEPVFDAEGKVVGGVSVVQNLATVDRIEKLRNEFLAMVSHELRTPITAIKGAAAAYLGSQRPRDATQVRELFGIVNEQVDRLAAMVDDLLDMSRIEAGVFSVDAEPVDLRCVVEDARALFLERGMDHRIEVSIPSETPAVNADPSRIRQVLENLLGNAIRYSPPGSRVTVAAEPGDRQVTVSVADRGRGIPREKLPELFRKFTRIDGPGEPRRSGAGLGLAICKGIIEAHRGRIWAESGGEGNGATFSFTLPVAAGPLPSAAPRAEPAGKVDAAGARPLVLAVDDDPAMIQLLRRCLNEAGYHMIAAARPAEGIRFLEQYGPDLVLLDLIFNGSSGFDALQQIRKVSAVPVIFLSGRDSTDAVVRALEMGADDYVTKPFAPAELVARIDAAVRRRALPDGLEVKDPYVLGDLRVDFARREVTVRGERAALTATEYKLLYLLAINAGKLLTHNQILQHVWGPEYAGESTLIRTFMRSLRAKLGDDARHPRYIATMWKVGYRMLTPGR